MPRKDVEQRRAYQREYRLRNWDKVTAQERKARHKRKDKKREHSREYHKRNREKHIEQVRDYHLRSKYGISLTEARAMWEEQNYRCANSGCRTLIARPGDFEAKQGDKAHIDHNHDTGEVRALLCRSCNIALGFLTEHPRRILGLNLYISEHTLSGEPTHFDFFGEEENTEWQPKKN